MSHHAFGDSFTNPGTGASAGHAYLTLLAFALSLSVVNHAVSGAQAGDQSIQAHAVSLGAADTASILIGTNDQWKYGLSTTKLDYYKRALTNIVSKVCAPSRVTAQSNGMTLTGTWTNNQPAWSHGKWTNTPGNKASAVVSGTAVYVTILKQEDYQGIPLYGSGDVYIDNVLVGSVSTLGTGIATQNGGANFSPPCTYRYGGLSAGSHTVEVRCTSSYADAQGVLYIEDIAGSDQPVKPPVRLSNITNMTPAAYASIGGSAANTAGYCAVIAQIVSDFIADGLDIALVDSNTAVSNSTGLSSDGCHPNDAGHLAIKAGFYAAMTGTLTYTPCAVYLGGDGNYYAGDGAQRKRLVLA